MSDIFRRDPRREWILRNRLHPEHQLLAQPVPESRGPGGLLRKNPHGVGFIGPNGIKRIDRLNVGNLVLSLIHISEPTRRLMASRMPSSA